MNRQFDSNFNFPFDFDSVPIDEEWIESSDDGLDSEDTNAGIASYFESVPIDEEWTESSDDGLDSEDTNAGIASCFESVPIGEERTELSDDDVDLEGGATSSSSNTDDIAVTSTQRQSDTLMFSENSASFFTPPLRRSVRQQNRSQHDSAEPSQLSLIDRRNAQNNESTIFTTMRVEKQGAVYQYSRGSEYEKEGILICKFTKVSQQKKRPTYYVVYDTQCQQPILYSSEKKLLAAQQAKACKQKLRLTDCFLHKEQFVSHSHGAIYKCEGIIKVESHLIHVFKMEKAGSKKTPVTKYAFYHATEGRLSGLRNRIEEAVTLARNAAKSMNKPVYQINECEAHQNDVMEHNKIIYVCTGTIREGDMTFHVLTRETENSNPVKKIPHTCYVFQGEDGKYYGFRHSIEDMKKVKGRRSGRGGGRPPKGYFFTPRDQLIAKLLTDMTDMTDDNATLSPLS